MKGNAVTLMMLILLLVGMLTLVFNIQSTKAESESLTLETDKEIYFLGENVKIILTNVSNETVDIGGYPAWVIYGYIRSPVYPRIFALLLWELDPGENDTLTWNQYNAFTESFVEPGRYYVEDRSGEALSDRVFFWITIPGDVDKDRDVDVGDQRKVQNVMFTVPGAPNWNSDMDIDGDGDVDVGDQRIQQNHMFETL